jgi:hypothetical protein
MSNILYISSHSILEYDEIKLLTELGHRVFSVGSYLNYRDPAQSYRPGIDLVQDPGWIKQYNDLISNDIDYALDRDFISNFDIIISMHNVDVLKKIISKKQKNQRLIFRSIGQSNSNLEKTISELKRLGLEVVRYSEKESLINGAAKSNAVIRFYKDEADFEPWNGKDQDIFFSSNSYLKRRHQMFHLSESVLNFNHFFWCGDDSRYGSLDFEFFKKKMASSRFCFLVVANPAPYNLTMIEYMAAGCPILFGLNRKNTYCEVVSLFSNKIKTVSSSEDILKIYNSMSIDDLNNLSKISQDTFFKNFSKKKIKIEWNNYLENGKK